MRQVGVYLFLSVLLILLPEQAHADDRCDLPEEGPCAPLAAAHAAFRALESASFSMDVALEVSDAAARQRVQFWAAVDGTFQVDKDIPLDMEDSATGIESLIDSLEADIDILFELPMSGVWAIPLLPGGSSSLSLRLVDGIGYVNMHKMDTGNGWLGVDLDALHRSGWGGALLEAAAILLDGESFTALLFAPPGQIHRRQDVTLNAQKMAVFEAKVDFDDLLNVGSQEQSVIRRIFEILERQPGARGLDRSILMATAEAYTQLLRFVSVDVVYTVGLNDSQVRAMELELAFVPQGDQRQLGLELARRFDPLGAAGLVLFDARLRISLTLDECNRAPAIAAPEDAQIMPPEDLLPPLAPGSPL